MTIIIKGMEMPNGCDDCYFCGEMGICFVLVATHINSGIVGEYRYSEFERPPFCPLVSVPPHGRLIDADALMKMCGMERDCYACQNGAHGYCTLSQDAANICEAIDDAPTIIPAEEGE